MEEIPRSRAFFQSSIKVNFRTVQHSSRKPLAVRNDKLTQFWLSAAKLGPTLLHSSSSHFSPTSTSIFNLHQSKASIESFTHSHTLPSFSRSVSLLCNPFLFMSSIQKKTDLDIAPSSANYGLSTNHKLISCWCLWATFCFASVICLFPMFNRASLWFPHLSLHLDKTDNGFWVYYVDEVLQVISQFATDLQGISLADYDADLDFVSNSIYGFDFASWCRHNPSAVSISCYSGHGLDVITALVTDMGVQVGIAGRMDNPSLFGDNLASTFKKIIRDLDQVYHDAKVHPSSDALDMDRLSVVHQVDLSMKLGHTMLILNLVHAILFLSTSLAFIVPMARGTFHGYLHVQIPMFVLLTLCEICTFANYTLETMYLRKLNSVFRVHGVIFTLGLGSTLLVMEFLTAIVLCILYFVYFQGTKDP
ncbi:hypothetical protein JCM33374_g463 [Metschnikowia sp. JCM 33374]|nr:hypothetical protein JCM33374_g463 [Metschnikowia sp. JCM 33374]